MRELFIFQSSKSYSQLISATSYISTTMRVPDFSFLLHLLLAMVLLVDVLAALSTMPQPLQYSNHGATDHQLRAQDSQAQIAVIGDEERVTFSRALSPVSDSLRKALPTNFRSSSLPSLPGQQHTSTSANPVVIQDMDVYSQFLALVEPLQNRRQTAHAELNAYINAAASTQLSLHTGSRPSISDPYHLIVLSSTLRIKTDKDDIKSNVDNWIRHLRVLVRFGFTRLEVEKILEKAQLNDAMRENLLKPYKKAITKDSIKESLAILIAFSDCVSISTKLRSNLDIRAAKVVAYRAQLKMTSDGVNSYDEWNFLLSAFVKRLYTPNRVREILVSTDVQQEEVEVIMGLYAKLLEKTDMQTPA
ncbi:hypothetical protein Plhal703r1_c03g0016581 [Plasmopara halstedii]